MAMNGDLPRSSFQVAHALSQEAVQVAVHRHIVVLG